MKKTDKRLAFVKPEKETEFRLRIGETVDTIKRQHYWVTDYVITGDAPKDFIKVYEYGESRKTNRKSWVGYIAKVGHKWYPNESITEYLLNRLGETLGLEMAKSRLVWISGQLRFLSRYFLNTHEALIHGAEIYANYLSDDKAFVKEIEDKDLAREFFTVQFTSDAIGFAFPKDSSVIMKALIKQLLFDAFVGNQDRHYFNWGVISDITKKKQPIFSPIYDTARALFWNESEQKIVGRFQDLKIGTTLLTKYIQQSRPKIGWEKERNINHIRLVELISQNEFFFTRAEILDFFSTTNLNRCFTIIDSEFSSLLSKERATVIKSLLAYRVNEIQKAI
jgi:hypothetical protein